MSRWADAGWLLAVAGIAAAYEQGRVRALRRGVTWSTGARLAWYGGATLLALVGEPPLATASHRSLWPETLQFGLLAFGVAPLTVLGLGAAHPADRIPGARRPRRAPTSATAGTACALTGFLTVTIAWRLPGAVDAVSSGEQWLALEAITLIAGSWWLWNVLLGGNRRYPPAAFETGAHRRLLRVALAAISAWSIWIFAYVVGFAQHAFYPAFAGGQSPMGTQEMAVGLLWATSSLALCPVMFLNLVGWLSSDEAEARAEESQLVRARGIQPSGGQHV